MARQSGHIFITGTIYDVTYYKMFGIYYARMKSSLSRKTVLTSPRFARTRMHAGQLADASRIASQLYRSIPKEERDVKIYRAFVGKAKVLLAEGKDKEVVLDILSNELNPKAKPSTLKQISEKKPKEKAYVNKKGRLVWKKLNPPNPLKGSFEYRTRNKETMNIEGNVQYLMLNDQFSIKRIVHPEMRRETNNSFYILNFTLRYE